MGSITALLSTVMFLQCLNTSLITVPLPQIARDLGVSLSESSWLLLAYSLGTCSLLLQFYKYGANNRLRLFMVSGLYIFTITSMISAIPMSFGLLCLVRFIQGAGISMSVAVAAAIVIRLLPEGRRGYVLGSMAAGTGLAMVLGPSLGGMLACAVPWEFLSLINVPVSVAAIHMAKKCLPFDYRPRRSADPDTFGCVCLFVAIASGLVFIENLFSGDAVFLMASGTAAYLALFLMFFRLTDNSRRAPVFTPEMFRSVPFVLISLSAIAGSMITEGVLYLLPYLMQISYGMSMVECSICFVLVSVTTLASARIVGRYCDAHSPRLPVLASFAVTLVFDAVFLVIDPGMPLWILVVPACLVGVAFAVFETAQYLRIMSVTADVFRSEAAVIVIVLTYVGASVGLVLYSGTFTMAVPAAAAGIEALTSAQMVEGFHMAAVLGSVIGIIGMILAYAAREETGIKSISDNPCISEASGQ